MTSYWTGLIASIALQHLWQSSVLLLLVSGMVRFCPLKASSRSWLWLLVLALAVVAPFAVLAPPQATPLLAARLALPQAAPGAVAELTVPPIQTAPVTHVIEDEPAQRAPVEAAPALRGTVEALIAFAWLLGTAWHLVRLHGAWRAARQLASAAQPMPWLERLMQRELPPGTRIKVSDAGAGPMALGLRHPCILVPRGLAAELGQDTLRDILNHEIAHIRRGDLWISLAQHVLTALFWWSPALRMIGTRLALAREMACDEHAVMQTGEPKRYARSLLASIDRLTRPHREMLASAIFGSPQAMTARMTSLLRSEAPAQGANAVLRALGWAAVLAAFVALAYTATPRLAAQAAGEPMPASPQEVALVSAAREGDLGAVRELVAAGASVNAAVGGDGTPLINAARSGNLELVNALLSLGADINLPIEGEGSPLAAAAAQGHLAIVERLLAAGANVNAINFYDETALINAVRAGHLEVVQALVAHGANVNLGAWADGQRWRTPLNQAGGPAMRDYLLSQGAKG